MVYQEVAWNQIFWVHHNKNVSIICSFPFGFREPSKYSNIVWQFRKWCFAIELSIERNLHFAQPGHLNDWNHHSIYKYCVHRLDTLCSQSGRSGTSRSPSPIRTQLATFTALRSSIRNASLYELRNSRFVVRHSSLSFTPFCLFIEVLAICIWVFVKLHQTVPDNRSVTASLQP